MKTIKYIDLYNRLRNDEELTIVQAIRSIVKIRHFDPEIKAALVQWLETGKCDLVVEDVSFNELTQEEEMKPFLAFKMLDWLKREPLLAYQCLAQRHMLDDLTQTGTAHISTAQPQDVDKSDIEL